MDVDWETSRHHCSRLCCSCEETLEAVTSVTRAPYLEYFNIRFEIPPDFEFPSEDVENVVTQYRD